MFVLLLSGAAGSGKSTVAAHLTSGKGGWVELSFAEPLKLIACDIWSKLYPDAGVTLDMFHDHVLKEKRPPGVPLTPREFLQFLGTDVMRARLGPDVWANHVASLIVQLTASKHNVVVSDLRFPNELEVVRAALAGVPDVKVVTVRIVRDGGPVPAETPTSAHFATTRSHASEHALDGTTFDHVIHNSSDVTGLLLAVNQLLITLVMQTAV